MRYSLRLSSLGLAWPLASLLACTPGEQPAVDVDGSSTTGDAGTTGIATGTTTDTTAGSSETTTGGDTSQVDESSGSSGPPLAPCDQIDEPDAEGHDENGDGIDGLAGCSVFVDGTLGQDDNDGLSPDVPVATVARGIEIASTFSPPRPVLVAADTYHETVTLVSGVSLYGSYAPNTWDRDLALHETTIVGTEFRTVVASGLNDAVELDGFTIEGPSITDASRSTYAVWVRDTPAEQLMLDHCTVVGSPGGHGASGIDGVGGDDGGDAGEGLMNGTGGLGGSSSCGATGGGGGNGAICPTLPGIGGSAGGHPTPVGAGGAPGESNCELNTNDCPDMGTDGSPGGDGFGGAHGSGGSASLDPAGEFTGEGLWVAPVGQSATDGFHGGGGGGGGAGGYDEDTGIFCLNTFTGNAAGGGGGGAGGCAGTAGTSGEPGGSSFCIVVVDAEIEVRNSELLLGIGGAGGSGGNGGDGGLGGLGAIGGPDDGGREMPGASATGGDGGSGGGGGGGGGGCGGSAIGIATVGGATVSTTNVSFRDGVAGAVGGGGSGGLRAGSVVRPGAPPGEDGCRGIVANEHDYP